jgi:hypothetical protein
MAPSYTAWRPGRIPLLIIAEYQILNVYFGMKQPKGVRFWPLLVPALWWLAHAVGYLVHEYAHAFTAWALGFKANPLALHYGHLTPGNVAFLLDIDENVAYGPIFVAGKGYVASWIAVAGVLFGNGILYFGSRGLYSFARQRQRQALLLFEFLLCLMNVGNFLCYVPVRTFATHADMATLEKGLHASPWWVVTVLGIPFAIAIWHFFAKLLPDACGFLFAGNRIPQFVLVVLSSFTVFVFPFGAAGIHGYGRRTGSRSFRRACCFRLRWLSAGAEGRARDARQSDPLSRRSPTLDLPQPVGGGFGGDVALGSGEHFVTDQKLADGRGAEERWEEMGVEVEGVVRSAVGGALVEAHGVGEGNLEETVVTGGEAAKDVGQGVALGGCELVDGGDVAIGKDERFEWPNGPEGDNDQEEIVGFDGALAGRALEAGVFAEKTRAAGGVPGLERMLLFRDLVGDGVVGPDLAMRVGIGGAHHGAAVFENLNVIDKRTGAEIGILLDPDIHHAAEVGQIHVGDGEVVLGREADDAADAGLAFGDEKAVAVETVWRSVGLEGGEIVIENEGGSVVRIVNAAGAGIAGAEIAGWVVFRLRRSGDGLDLSEPGTGGAMGRNEHPFAGERVEAAVRILLPVEHQLYGNGLRRADAHWY